MKTENRQFITTTITIYAPKFKLEYECLVHGTVERECYKAVLISELGLVRSDDTYVADRTVGGECYKAVPVNELEMPGLANWFHIGGVYEPLYRVGVSLALFAT